MSLSYKFDYEEHSLSSKAQIKFNYEQSNLNQPEINLDESFIDPDLLYYERDLPEILSPSIKGELASFQLPLHCMQSHFITKNKLASTKSHGKDSDLESSRNEESTINGSSYKVQQRKELSSLNSICEEKNKETRDILQIEHSDGEYSSSESSNDSAEKQNSTLSLNDGTNSENSLNSIIINSFLKNIEKQNKIEKDEVTRRKIGRPSNYKSMKSSDINDWLKDIFKNKLVNLLCNKTKEIRIDLFTTEYFRIIRKIPHYFVRDFWTQIYFKNPDITKSVVGLVEAFSAYSFSQNNFDATNIIERVVDFSVIYFSEEKWVKLINELTRTSDRKLRSVFEEKLKILQLRRKSSTKSMREFVCSSSTMRELFRIALHVLSQFLGNGPNKKYVTSNTKNPQNGCSSDRKMTTRKAARDTWSSTLSNTLKTWIFSDSQKMRAKYLYQKTKKVLNW